MILKIVEKDTTSQHWFSLLSQAPDVFALFGGSQEIENTRFQVDGFIAVYNKLCQCQMQFQKPTLSNLDCKFNFLEMLIQNEISTLFNTERNQVNKDNQSPFHLAQLKQLTTISHGCFGHAEWNGSYNDVCWLVILVSLSVQSISFVGITTRSSQSLLICLSVICSAVVFGQSSACPCALKSLLILFHSQLVRSIEISNH